MQIVQGKSYWFYLSPKVYVEQKDSILLYHTGNGDRLVVAERSIKALISSVLSPKNLGVVQLPDEVLASSEALEILEVMLRKEIGGLIPRQEAQLKPINFLPILNLQKDIDKAKAQGNLSLVLDNLLGYLSRCIIYLGGECSLSQTYLCGKVEVFNQCWIPQGLLKLLLEQARHSRLTQLLLYSDNLFEHPEIADILQLFENYELDYQFYLSATHYIRCHSTIRTLVMQSDITINITLLCTPDELNSILSISEASPNNLKLVVLVEDDKAYSYVHKVLGCYDMVNYECIPVYTTRNKGFFEDFVYLSEEDILSTPIEFRHIFCNQKLNSSCFGTLVLLPDGACKASPYTQSIGTLQGKSLPELVYHELIYNTAWRKTRCYEPCSSCLYQYLCPPPSTYEQAIGKGNLCNIF